MHIHSPNSSATVRVLCALRSESMGGMREHDSTRLRAYPGLGEKLFSAKGIVSDLDYTLVNSKPVFATLDCEVATLMGVTHHDFIATVEQRMRGKPPKEFIAELHRATMAVGGRRCTLDEFMSARAEVLQKIEDGSLPITGGIQEIPGASRLLNILVREWHKTLEVCTHCPRGLAVQLIKKGGFSSLVTPEFMVCGDDIKVSKNDPEYWKQVIPQGESRQWVGIDDTADGAEWMLRAADLGGVLVRPSAERYRDRLEELKREFPQRLFIVSEFSELFA